MAPGICMTRTTPLKDTRGRRGECMGGWDAPAGGEAEADLWLLQRCAGHDPAALRELVQRYQQKLYRLLHPILESHEDTEEAVQDVFLRVWQQAGRFQGRSSFSTWLYRIAANIAYDVLRRRKTQCRTTPLLDVAALHAMNSEEEALQSLEREERARQLQQALQALRVEDRLLLLLHYAEELDYPEIGEITGHSYPVLKVRLMRARRRLRAALDSLTPEVTE